MMKKVFFLSVFALIMFSGCHHTTLPTDPEMFDPEKIASLKPAEFTFNIAGVGPVKFTALKADSFAVVQGDIIIPLAKDSVNKDRYQLRSWTVIGKTWPNATIYYKIDAGVDAAMIQDAMNE